VNKQEYAAYLQSPWWRRIARDMRELYPVCQRCEFPYELNVHHLTYERLGCEKVPQDLIVLCRSCHSREHFLQDIDKLPWLVDDVGAVREKIYKQTEDSRQKNAETYGYQSDEDDG